MSPPSARVHLCLCEVIGHIQVFAYVQILRRSNRIVIMEFALGDQTWNACRVEFELELDRSKKNHRPFDLIMRSANHAVTAAWLVGLHITPWINIVCVARNSEILYLSWSCDRWWHGNQRREKKRSEFLASLPKTTPSSKPIQFGADASRSHRGNVDGGKRHRGFRNIFLLTLSLCLSI